MRTRPSYAIDTLLSTVEVSQALGIPRATVRRLFMAGAFGPLMRNRSGHHRVHWRNVVAFDRTALPAEPVRRGSVSDSELFWLYDQDLPAPWRG